MPAEPTSLTQIQRKTPARGHPSTQKSEAWTRKSHLGDVVVKLVDVDVGHGEHHVADLGRRRDTRIAICRSVIGDGDRLVLRSGYVLLWPDVAIMSDEIYDHMVYDGEAHVCLLTYPSIRDRLILLNGWSKTYAMTGWRLGYAVWPGKLYDYARKLAVNLHSCVNASAQYAGLAALKGPQDEVIKMVAEFDKRRKVVVEGLNKLPGVSCVVPKGAFYAFPNVKRTGWKAKELANSLLNETGVVTIGGPDFGILGEGYLRLSYANSTENILKALGRMGDFLSTRKAA